VAVSDSEGSKGSESGEGIEGGEGNKSGEVEVCEGGEVCEVSEVSEVCEVNEVNEVSENALQKIKTIASAKRVQLLITYYPDQVSLFRYAKVRNISLSEV
jgi:hypothetical protein